MLKALTSKTRGGIGMGDKKQRKNVVLASAAPIADGGRKYNSIYWISGIVFFVIGLISFKQFGGGVLLGILGLGVGWIIKTLICDSQMVNLRDFTFSCGSKPPYDDLIQSLQSVLIPLGMTIEKKSDGAPSITYKGLIYDVVYNDDGTFSIWWRTSLATAIITGRLYIALYRKACVAYGIIAYYVQQLCKSTEEQSQQQSQAKFQQSIQQQQTQVQPQPIIQQPQQPEQSEATNENSAVSQEEEKLFCSQCGKQIPLGSVFCPVCGAKIIPPESNKNVIQGINMDSAKNAIMNAKAEASKVISKGIDVDAVKDFAANAKSGASKVISQGIDVEAVKSFATEAKEGASKVVTQGVDINAAKQYIEQAKTDEKKRKTLISIAGVILVVIVLVVLVSSQFGGNRYINMVKKGTIGDYTSETVGKAFDDFFGSEKWKYKKIDGDHIVTFTGECSLNGEDADVEIDFIVDPDDDTFMVSSLSCNGEDMGLFALAGLCESIYG